VDLPLGHCDALEDAEGMLFDERREVALLDQFANLPVSPSVNMLVSVAVLMAVVAFGRVMIVVPAAFLAMIMVTRFAM
jgi:hypothetical protein